MAKLRKIIGAFLKAPERFDELAERIAETTRCVDRLNEINPVWLEWITQRLCRDPESLRELNREMSVQRTVWGDPARLVIAPGAAVETCLFNVNSGTIRIGRYTFAGSGVSILAGSHDPELRGFLRRDAELAEGCDITVGEGVWLASGCMLLGPCEVGDNAVIAAGAVVIPGTKVPANTIWGGVPAKQIGKLADRPEEITEDAAVLRAMQRENGILFTEGWSEKKIIPGRAESCRYMEGTLAGILTNRSRAVLEYGIEGAESCRLKIRGSLGETETGLAGAAGKTAVALPCAEGKPELLRIERETASARLWVRMIPEEEGSAET